jgi:DNA-binding transcriptional MocR family regulator
VPLRFEPPAMATLVDAPVTYDLAESTCPAVVAEELLSAEVRDRLAKLALDYGTSQGDPRLRGLIAAAEGAQPEEVLVTVGSIAGMFLLAMVACGPGGHAVLAEPCFPPARSVLDAIGAEVSTVRTRFDEGYRIDPDRIAAALRPDTLLVSIATPQNPSGVATDRERVEAIAAAMARRAPRAVLLVDECYRAAAYAGDTPAPSAAALGGRVVTCSSLSKSHGAPGLRTGWLVVADRELREGLRSARFQSVIASSGVDDLLACAVLERADELLGERGALLSRTLATLEAFVAEHAEALEWVRPDAGALCCLRLRPGRYDGPAVERFHAALAERDARVAPGAWFGDAPQCFRLGFGHLPEARFGEALARLADALA